MSHEHEHEHAHAHSHSDAGHETSDVDVRVLAIYGVVLTVLLLVVHFGMLAAYRMLMTYRTPESGIAAPVNIYEQLHALRKAEDETLGSYGWVDRKEGVVRIPIDRAIGLAATRGVPHGKGPKTEVELNSHHGIPAKPEEAAAEKAQPKPKENQP